MFQNEINKIEICDLSTKKHLELTRCMFLFSCYTGMRYSDVVALKKENYKNGVITLKQVKTGVDLKVPVNIEAKKSDFTKKKEINKASYQMSCTRENVGQLAALTIYLICKFNSPKLGVEINDYLMRRATARKEETSECPSGAVESWSIESAKLWKLYNEMAKRKIAKKNEYDVDAIKVYAKSLLNEGVEFYEVVRKIYIKYINLTAAQLGKIFPYEEGTDIEHTGMQSRWKTLQKELFVRYPELIKEKSEKKKPVKSL